MKKTITTISLCLLTAAVFAQAPQVKPDTIVVDPVKRAQALQTIQNAFGIIGQSVTPLKTDEAIQLKQNLQELYNIMSTVATKPKEEVKPVKK